jgi:cyclophilin family peptidyl-prolyl cis-trans isomerase
LRTIARLALLIALSLLTSAAHAANPVVRFTTVLGSYDVELCYEVSALCPGAAPVSVSNFLAYVDFDRYPATSFIHRRGAGGASGSPLVIQGGGYYIGDLGGGQGQGALQVTTFRPIKLEIGVGLSNLRGTIAMARSTLPDTANSQWFINLVDNVDLDTAGGGYAVFGKVTDPAGLAVVDAIGALTIYLAGDPFNELPLISDPGLDPLFAYLVYVSSVTRVPEPGDALASAVALGALAVLTRRRA